jgi:hypothetical protein
LLANIPYFTTMAAAMAAVNALETWSVSEGMPRQVRSLQEWHARARKAESATRRSARPRKQV